MNKEELYYVNLLTRYKKLMIFCNSAPYIKDMVEDIINSTKTNNRPTIVITSCYSSGLKGSVKRDELVIENPKYRDIELLKGADNRNKILVFKNREIDYENREFVATLEFAMLANKIMVQQGGNPLIIIENFEELFHEYKYVKSYDYFAEVMLNELSDTQNLILISISAAPYYENYDESADFYRVIRKTDAMIFAPNSIANAHFGPFADTIWGIKTIFKTSKEDMSDMLKNFEEICKDEMRLRKGLVFDFNEKTIEDFNGRPD